MFKINIVIILIMTKIFCTDVLSQPAVIGIQLLDYKYQPISGVLIKFITFENGELIELGEVKSNKNGIAKLKREKLLGKKIEYEIRGIPKHLKYENYGTIFPKENYEVERIILLPKDYEYSDFKIFITAVAAENPNIDIVDYEIRITTEDKLINDWQKIEESPYVVTLPREYIDKDVTFEFRKEGYKYVSKALSLFDARQRMQVEFVSSEKTETEEIPSTRVVGLSYDYKTKEPVERTEIRYVIENILKLQTEYTDNNGMFEIFLPHNDYQDFSFYYSAYKKGYSIVSGTPKLRLKNGVNTLSIVLDKNPPSKLKTLLFYCGIVLTVASSISALVANNSFNQRLSEYREMELEPPEDYERAWEKVKSAERWRNALLVPIPIGIISFSISFAF